MKKHKLIYLIASLLMVGVLTGCHKNPFSNTVTIVDMEGTEVTVPKNVKNVACISQSATDLMIAFGLGDRIIGTYRSFTYNKWAEVIYPNSKNYKAYSYSVSAEELLNDGVELVIIQDTENAQSFRNAGIPVIAVHQYSPTGAFDDEVYDVANILKEVFPSCKSKANAWIKDVKDTINDIQSKIGTVNSERAIYYVNGEKSKGLYYSDGGNSMISRVFDIANVRLATEKYEVLNVHKVSNEEMVALNPYAMMIGGAYQNNLKDELKNSEVWSSLECNQNNRVYTIPVCMVGIENVSAETPVMLKLAAAIFNDYECDICTEMQHNLKTYFNYDMSITDYMYMTRGLDQNGNRMV